MSSAENRDILLRFLQSMSSEQFEEVCHVDIQLPEHYPWEGRSGLDALQDGMAKLGGGLTDYHVQVEDIFADDECAVCRIRFGGTHTGDLLGLQPTGKEFEIEEITFAQIRDGKIARLWAVPDRLSVAQQLGALG